MNAPAAPPFITLEGSEGCGKSTQIDRLRARLEGAGQRVVVCREPGGTTLGEALRQLLKYAPEGRGMCPESELLLFAASRAQLVREVIEPALADGAFVLCDRFADSTTVYQGVARKLPPAAVVAANDIAMGGVRPGITLVFDLDLDTALDRLRRRPRPAGQVDRLEALPREFFEDVRAGYRSLAEREPGRVRLLDAGASPDEVEAAAWRLVSERFGL